MVTEMPEVMEFHRMAGDVDYMLKVIVPDIQAFDDFYKRLIGTTAINEVTSRFSMETIKETTALPISRGWPMRPKGILLILSALS